MELNQSHQLYNLLGETLLIKSVKEDQKKHSQEVETMTLKNFKLIGLLFSASWCPPCLGFLTHLKDFYHQVNETEAN